MLSLLIERWHFRLDGCVLVDPCFLLTLIRAVVSSALHRIEAMTIAATRLLYRSQQASNRLHRRRGYHGVSRIPHLENARISDGWT